MSKAVMISIRPEWVEKICRGEKTVEVRKTRPKLQTPFKCYIYCTRDKYPAFMQNLTGANLISCMDAETAIPVGGFVGNGTVIGEFTCDSIYETETKAHGGSYYVKGEEQPTTNAVARQSCLNLRDMHEYLQSKIGYGWHISDLVVYDRPKELSEFSPVCRYKNDDGSCPSRRVACSYQREDYNSDGTINIVECGKTIERPPQSWFHVEENVSEIQRKVNEPVDALNELRKDEQK